MTEEEYIIVSNKSAIMAALRELSEVMIYPKCGITKETFYETHKLLTKLLNETREKIIIDVDDLK